MKKLLPILAIGLVAAACTDQGDHDHYNNRTGERTDGAYMAPAAVVSPVPSAVVTRDGTMYRQDGVYAVTPGQVVVQPEGYQHKHSDDALSDRSLGATRGSHTEPMTAKDADNDGNYDYQPYWGTRGRDSYRVVPATTVYSY